MGSKAIIFLGIVMSVLFLYLCVSGQNINLKPTVSMNIGQALDEIEEKPEIEIKPQELEESVETEIKEEPEVTEVISGRISIATFGFMISDKNQVIALMSDNDQNGILAQRIERLCEEEECIKDMRYGDDIIDAPWQEEAVKIINLLVGKEINNASLFIENNTLKLEGSIENLKTKKALDDILESIKSDKFKIENYSKLVQVTPIIPIVETEKITKPIIKTKPVSIPETVPPPVMETTLDVVDKKQNRQKEIDKLLLLKPIYFKNSSSTLTDNDKNILDELIEIINSSNDVVVEVFSFGEVGGDEIYNKVISQTRADAVMNYIQKTAVTIKSIKSIGKIGEKPSGSNPKNQVYIKIETEKGE